MTIIIGIHCKEYITIAADNRKTFYSSKNFVDGVSKISKFKNGLITGTGYNVLLESVKNEFSKKIIKDLNTIKKTIEKEQELLVIKILNYNKSNPKKIDIDPKKVIEETSFMIAYKKRSTQKIYLYYIEIKNKVTNYIEIKEGSNKVSFPSNLDYYIFKKKMSVFSKKINYNKKNKSINKNKRFIKNLIYELQKKTNTISKSFNIETISI